MIVEWGSSGVKRVASSTHSLIINKCAFEGTSLTKTVNRIHSLTITKSFHQCRKANFEWCGQSVQVNFFSKISSALTSNSKEVNMISPVILKSCFLQVLYLPLHCRFFYYHEKIILRSGKSQVFHSSVRNRVIFNKFLFRVYRNCQSKLTFFPF